MMVGCGRFVPFTRTLYKYDYYFLMPFLKSLQPTTTHHFIDFRHFVRHSAGSKRHPIYCVLPHGRQGKETVHRRHAAIPFFRYSNSKEGPPMPRKARIISSNSQTYSGDAAWNQPAAGFSSADQNGGRGHQPGYETNWHTLCAEHQPKVWQIRSFVSGSVQERSSAGWQLLSDPDQVHPPKPCQSRPDSHGGRLSLQQAGHEFPKGEGRCFEKMSAYVSRCHTPSSDRMNPSRLEHAFSYLRKGGWKRMS